MWVLFVFGLLLATIAGLIFDPMQVPWRIVEVGSILAGSLAIVSAIAEWRRIQPTNELPALKNRVHTALITLRSVTKTYLAIVRMRIERRASSLEQYEAVLPRFERILELAMIDEAAEPSSLLSQLGDLPSDLDDVEIVTLNSEINLILAIHEQALEKYRQGLCRLDKTIAEELLTFALPLLITISVSLSLFKALYQPYLIS